MMKSLGKQHVLFVKIKLLDDITVLWHAKDVRDSSREVSGKVSCIHAVMVEIVQSTGYREIVVDVVD